jgi:putative ABC transport system permease protein
MLGTILREALGNLLASRQRSGLALLGILIGAGAVIAMLNLGAMARNETVKQFRQMGTDTLALRANSATGTVGFDPALMAELPRLVPGLVEVAPMALGGGQVGFAGATHSATLVGTSGALVGAGRLRVAAGRFLSEFDRFEPFVVAGADVAAQLSTPYAPLRPGSEIRIGRAVLTVIGVLEPSLPNPLMPVDANSSLFVSIPSARRLMANPTLTMAAARAAPEADPEAVADGIRRHVEPALREATLTVQTARALLAGMQGQMQLFALLLAGVGGIALLLGGVGVMNVMLVSVSERRREIGIRLAIGARRADVRSLFLAEAVLLAVLGGSFGALAGIAASWGVARATDWDFLLNPVGVPVGAGVSVIVGIFSGFYPAVLAARLDPIEALRTE